jgi:hypothetical protein
VLQRQGREREAMEQFLQAARLDPTSTTARDNLEGSVGRHLSPDFTVSRPVQIGLILLGLALPPVRALFLAWGLVNLVRRWLKRRALPPAARMAYDLRTRRRFSWLVVLVWAGLLGALAFGVPGLIIEQMIQSSQVQPHDATNDLLAVAGCFIILTVIACAALWWRAWRSDA